MPSYPIDHILPEVKAAVRANSAVIIQAPPGAGKTTRVPLALLEEFSPRQGKIIMLEPRRIAAVAAARWMARQRGEPVGRTVGYAIRFDSRISADTRLEVVTEGILTRRLLDDPTLDGVSLIVFDEFHERSLQADLALALCLDIQRGLRDDLKLLAMSATLDIGPLAALLGDAPVISSPGRAFPVAERYLAAGDRGRERSREERVIGAVRTALAESPGDILVFLPGSGEIRRAATDLHGIPAVKGGEAAVHPLYGDLPFAEQERAIQPGRKRKIVLATNIAETSLTIEGIRVVIDSGLTRRLQYDPATGMNRLVTVKTSRAAAIQRQGRAGRIAPGVCYRLYSPHDFQTMIPFAPPEILVADLSSLVLELASWGVTDPAALSWLDPPPEAAWTAARELLSSLGALDRRGAPTELGREMARLPLTPRLGCLLLRAARRGFPGLGADLAALLSERDIIRSGFRDPMFSGRNGDISERLFLLRRRRGEKMVREDAPDRLRRRQSRGDAPADGCSVAGAPISDARRGVIGIAGVGSAPDGGVIAGANIGTTAGAGKDVLMKYPAPSFGEYNPERLIDTDVGKNGSAAAPVDPGALARVERAASQLRRLAAITVGGRAPDASGGRESGGGKKRRASSKADHGGERYEGEMPAALLLHAYPDRIARRRDEGGDRYLLSQGRGVRLPRESNMQGSVYLVVPRLDAGEKAEGIIHLAEAVTEETIRSELAGRLEVRRRVVWNRQEERIVSLRQECLGALLLAETSFPAMDDEAVPLLCQAIVSGEARLDFRPEMRQFQGRVALLKRCFPDEGWPDLSDAELLAAPEVWLAPRLAGVRTGAQLAALDLLPSLRALLPPAQQRLLENRAPTAVTVPSGRRVPLDYAAGPAPVLAVKLQEMFGLAATPTVADGRVAVRIHLLSPAGRPVQVTEDLKSFWENGYPQVKKELKGRYPKHPWPDDPWHAAPTGRTQRRLSEKRKPGK